MTQNQGLSRGMYPRNYYFVKDKDVWIVPIPLIKPFNRLFPGCKRIYEKSVWSYAQQHHPKIFFRYGNKYGFVAHRYYLTLREFALRAGLDWTCVIVMETLGIDYPAVHFLQANLSY